MKTNQNMYQIKKNNGYYEDNRLKVNQSIFQDRKRASSNHGLVNINQIPLINFRKSSYHQNKIHSSSVCPESSHHSGYHQLSSILKDLQLPKSNHSSKNMMNQFSKPPNVPVGNLYERNSNRNIDNLKMELCDLMLKKNKSRQKYEDIARKYGDGSQMLNVNHTPINKKSSNVLQIPLGSFGSSSLNLTKQASMIQRISNKSPSNKEDDLSTYFIKAPSSPYNQKYQIFKQENPTRKTIDVNPKQYVPLKVNSIRSTLDSFTKQKTPYKIIQKPQCLKAKGSKVNINDFLMTKKLGEGKFGEVFRVIHKQTYSLYALKRIKKSAIKTYMMDDQMMMQIKLQLFFNHPNILKLYSIFDDETYIYLLLEYMEQGTLFAKLKKSGVLKEDETSRIMYDMLKGVNYLHENDIAHRDIKPQNIVVSNGICKLCDFGWSAICKDDRRTTMCGTLDYSAPQIIEGKQYSKSIDLWCLGVMTFELIIGKAPFYHINRKETMKKIINQNHEQLKFPATISHKAKDFISKFLLWQPQNRLEAQAALKESFIKDYNEQ